MNQFEIIHREKRMLGIFGLYSRRDDENGVFFKIRRALIAVFSTVMLICLFIKMYENRNNLLDIFETCYYFMVQAAFVIKLYIYFYHLPDLHALEEMLSGKIFNSLSKEQEMYISDAMKSHKIFAGCYQFCCVCCAIIYSIFPAMDGQALAVPIYSPFNVEKYRMFLYCFEVCCFFMTACNNSSFDGMTVGLTTIMSAQLDVLKDNLKHAADRDMGGKFLEQEKKIKDRLRNCVRHHNAILEFTAKTQDIFSTGVFFQILASMLGICLTGLQSLMVPWGSVQFASVGLFLVTEIIQIGMFCWFGENIIIKSSEIELSCYMSEWRSCSTSNKRIFLIIMENAKTPIKFTAKGLFILSLGTFVMVLRSGYSYFAVLRQVSQK
nr:odorant receptor 7 [Holotrichia oblita]